MNGLCDRPKGFDPCKIQDCVWAYPLVKRLHGQVVKLSPTSKSYVNPLDINLNYSEDENPLALKSDFVLSFCELVMGGKNGLEAIEKTVIDRAVQVIYRPYLADPRPENMPILSDLHQALLDQHIPEADRVAQALDLYVNGSLAKRRARGLYASASGALFYSCSIGKCGSSSSSFRIRCCFISSSTASSSIMGV